MNYVFTPFGPLSQRQIELGFSVEEYSEGLQCIVIPQNISVTTIKEISVATDLSTFFISKNNIQNQKICFEPGTYNLANFSVDNLSKEIDVLLNKVVSIFDKLSILIPNLEKDQILFSAKGHSVSILPYFKIKNE